MKIAIFGSDSHATAIGRLLVDAGYHVCFGDAEGMKPAEAAAERAGALADTPYNDAAVCEMLIFAAPREQMDALIAQAGRVSPQAVVVDAMQGPLADGESGPELLARKLDTHRVVRALIMSPQPGATILYCGDDADAMTVVEEVFRTAGCVTTDRGPLANAAEIEAPPNAANSGESSFETLKSANTLGPTKQ
ncbi:MAG: NAD(P)-binding domain-containing protein [Candidatus Cybelea sp.]